MTVVPEFQFKRAALPLTGNPAEWQQRGYPVGNFNFALSSLYSGCESHSSPMIRRRPFPDLIKERQVYNDIPVETPGDSLQDDNGHNARMGSTDSSVTIHTY